MKIQLFKNNKGLIYGNDPKRMDSDKEGVLRIGTAELAVSPETSQIVPVLFGGCSGEYQATFTDKDGKVWELEKVTVRGGRIAPPPPTAVEFMDIRCRLEEAEDRCESLEEKVRELANIFDTNSLNFLIN